MESLFTQAEYEAPIEACGYLAGTDGQITRHFPLTNIDGKEDHFSFDPQEQFATLKAARQEGLSIIGMYHSHPASPARPSPEDVRLAYDPTIVYIIISLMNDTRTVRGFYIRKGEVVEEPLTIGENTNDQ
ncbi:M67 family metallopeptidase [Methanosphaerula palustris]|nr:M67 family metallopeptidase [Methanosphaerula palustris]